MILGKYSFGIGDRFNQEGKAQLKAIMKASEQGIDITPVWNKSNREHNIVKSEPSGTRKEADEAVHTLGWKKAWFVDADHINLDTVDRFVSHCNFFTLDVAQYIGRESSSAYETAFYTSCESLGTRVEIPGIADPINITPELLEKVAKKYLAAVKEAGNIYRRIEGSLGIGSFVTEISMDEVETPQTPVELFFILKMIAGENIPVQTIAPKFTGRFNKGVDYKGDVNAFAKEFEEDLLVIDYAIREFDLPSDLKLSVHSGSDKFSIYPVMARLIRKHNKGIHVKTAGTTWLEEVIGLALAGGEALDTAKEIYTRAYERSEELCGPYADVIEIDESKLPDPSEVQSWDSEKFANTLRHIPDHPDYNPNFRQLMHVGYKVAAEMGQKYISLLNAHEEIVAACVEENIFDRHLKRLFDLK